LDANDESYVEEEDDGNDNLKDRAKDSRHFQGFIIQLWDISESVILRRSCQWGQKWENMQNDVVNWIQESSIFQKIKVQKAHCGETI